MTNELVKSKFQHHNSIQLDYYSGKMKRTMLPVNSYYVNRHIEEFIKYSGISKNDIILEVGCGMGKFTFPMLKRGYKITGLDLSPTLLQKLQEYNDNKFQIDLIASDILEIPEKYNEQFDHVIGFFTLHHLRQLETYLQAGKRVLKPNGSIIFLEPNAYNPLYYFQIVFSPTMSWKGDKGVAQMTSKKIYRAAQYSGLKNVLIHKYGFFPPFVVNNPISRFIETSLEKMKIFKGVSAFQIIKLDKPELK